MARHMLWVAEDFVEQATAEFVEAMAELDGLEDQIGEALNELEELNGGAR